MQTTTDYGFKTSPGWHGMSHVHVLRVYGNTALILLLYGLK